MEAYEQRREEVITKAWCKSVEWALVADFLSGKDTDGGVELLYLLEIFNAAVNTWPLELKNIACF